MVPDSQGLVVAFDGVTLQRLTSVNCDGGSVALVDCTTVNCLMVGNGDSLRVVRIYLPGDLTRGVCDVTFQGPQGLGTDDVGRVGILTVTWKGQGTYTRATLTSWKITGNVNDVIRGSATWHITG